MSKSESQTAYADWQKRIARYQQAGIPSSAYLPIANKDLSRIYSQGGTTMTNAEADVSVYAAAKGTNPIAEAPRHKSGLFGGLETVLSNIVPDVSNIVTDLPRGLIDLGKAAVSPKQWEQTAGDLGSFSKDMLSGQSGQAVRDLAKSPMLSLIPGVADAAALTTSAGRKQLEEHPVTATLDVLPLTKPLAAGAGVALAADATGALGEGLDAASTLNKLRGKVDVRGADPSAQAALVAGRPFQAALRGLDRKLGTVEDPITGKTMGRGQKAISSVLKNAKLDAANRLLSTTMNRAELSAYNTAGKEAVAQIDQVFEPLGLTGGAADRAILEDFTRKAVAGDTGSMTDAELATYNKYQTFRLQLIDQYGSDLRKFEEGYYAKDSPVVKAHGARDRIANKHQKAVDLHQQSEDRLAQAKENQARQVTAAQQVMTLLHSAGAKVKADVRNKTLRNLAKANTEVKRATAAYEKTAKAGVASGKALRDADEKLQKSIIRNPPANLHPVIRSTMRDKVAKAYLEGKGEADISTEKVREMTISSQYSEVLKDIRDTPALNGFYQYIGKDETKALFADSVQEALKLAEQGIAPVYMHEYRSTTDITNVHVAREQDLREAQVRQKAFNMQSSVFNIKAALTREMFNTIERDAMQEVYEKSLKPFEKNQKDLLPIYIKAARTALEKGKYTNRDVDSLATHLMEKDWSKFSYEQYGIRRSAGAIKEGDMFIPRQMAENLKSFSGGGQGVAGFLSHNKGYNTTMKVFRTSVLYGPRHFAHVVIGGLMPVMVDSPTALTDFPTAWKALHALSGGKPLSSVAGELAAKFDADPQAMEEILKSAGLSFNYSTDAAAKHLDTKVGQKHAALLKDYWEKTGGRVDEGTKKIEDYAQSMYQLSVALSDIKKGADPFVALEHMRRMVVNLDGMSPFERTVLKQVFPFYSFTRFATKFLVQLPFDHPLRVGILSQLSAQAQEEWGTGLPQSMMTLLFFGSPGESGNIMSMNLRNANPFRSVPSMFTMTGFMESLNPILQAPFVMAGFNPLQGSGELYPNIVYDAQTGSLVAARPKGDLMTAAEQFVPELGGIDAAFGMSDNFRTLKASDPGALERELENMFNIPFAVSSYNLPQVRGRTAENAYKGAQNAVTAFKKGGNFDDTIGRYQLVPYQGRLVTPQQFATFWAQETQLAHQQAPSIATAAFVPSSSNTTPQATLQQLINFYGS